MEKIYNFYALSASDSPQDIRYIGVTTRSVKERFYQHKYCALHDEKRALPVHKWMYSKYKQGIDILVKQIDSCSESFWEQKEVDLIKKYNEGGRLLNIDKGGKGVITKEKRELDGIQRSVNAHKKGITLFDINGNIVASCESINEAHEKFGLNKTSIGNVLHGRSKTCGGYYIVETSIINDDFNILTYINNLELNCSKKKAVYQFSLDGNFVNKYSGVVEAGKVTKDRNKLKKCIDAKVSYKGYFWSYTNNIDLNEFKA